MVDYLRPQWPRGLLLSCLVTVGIALQLVSPQIIRTFIDTVVASASESRPGVGRELTAAAMAYLGVSAAIQVLSLASTYLSETVGWTATNALRRDLTLHCLKLDMSFHKAHTPGELIERIDGDVNRLANFFSQMAIQMLGNGLLAVGILIALFYEDSRVGGVGVGYICLMAISLRTVQGRAVSAWGDSRQAESSLLGFLGERLTATEDIRANGAERYVMAGLYRLMRVVFHAWRKAKMLQGLSRALEATIYLLAYASVLAIGGWLFTRGQMTIGAVYLLIHYLSRLRAPLMQIRSQVDDLQQASASIGRVEALLLTRSSLPEIPRASLPSGALSVSFGAVSFRYEDRLGGSGRESVLEDISFALARGRVLGLLGRTGSGKTTLTRLLFRLYDPTRGAIRLGDANLLDLRLSDLRGRVGLVTQDVQLFHGSVRDNVSLFSKRVSDGQIENALSELGLWEWVQSLPNGLGTELSAGGSSLSAGEAQLLAFTRVYLKDPGLVVLDEASSRLDPATERLLERAIDRLLQDRTAIIVAHRLSTVQRADEIMVLEEGRVCEWGPRVDLANDPGSRFHGLLQTGLAEVLA
jgi:ABC-type multidrug transport system fused ATPase/permease subunit